MLERIKHEEDLTVEYFQSILDATHIEGSDVNTEYSSVIDLKNGIIHLNHWHKYNETATICIVEEIEKHSDYAPVTVGSTRQSLPMRIKDLFSERTVRKIVRERKKYRNRNKIER